MDGRALSPEEAKFYRGVFMTLDWHNNKQISSSNLKLLLQSSRLPAATLSQLWTLSSQLAAREKRDWLSDRDICIVIRLISVAQAGQQPSYEAIKAADVPLPKLDINFLREEHKKAIAAGTCPAPPATAGAPPQASPAPGPAAAPAAPPPAAARPAASPAAAPPASPSPAAPPAASPPPAAAEGGDVDWTMTEAQKIGYGKSFEQLDKNGTGLCSAADAVGFLRRSKLPEGVLREIWKLSDIGRDGALDLAEFCIAMHLVMKARAGVPMPTTLPNVLMPAKSAAAEAEKKEAEEKKARMEKEAEEAKRAVIEQQLKEQKEREQQEQQRKEQEQRDQQERERREQQAKEQAEQQAKDQAARETQAREQAAREQQSKEQQDQSREQQSKEQQDQKAEAKPAEDKAPDEPRVSKFKKPTGDEASVGSQGSAGASAVRARSREPRPPEAPEAKRPKSPTPRTARSPAPRSGKPGEPTSWDNSVKVDPSESVPSKPDSKVASRVAASNVKNLDAPVATKTPAVRKWIEELLHETIPTAIPLLDALKSGVRICRVLNVIEPNSVLDISLQQYMKRENIIEFLDALRRKGFKPHQLFVLEDLFEAKDFDAVLQTLLHVDAYAEAIGFDGPRIKWS